ncbi:MAG: hypothetical protein PUG43_04430 [Clostridiales bacterium]|nr:hypothetical protein [Clostridiales bacterium]MDD7347749.1 hypothetical protein [Clostridiales bacterium]MDY4060446.1 hypothetical protein [Anaerovoracaceae bacterium]
MKLGNKAIKGDEQSLVKLANKVDKDPMNVHSFLAVVTGNGYAYGRKDGIYVIPIECLKIRPF